MSTPKSRSYRGRINANRDRVVAAAGSKVGQRDFVQGFVQGCRSESSWYYTLPLLDQLEFDVHCIKQAEYAYSIYADLQSQEGPDGPKEEDDGQRSDRVGA